jgi:mono/diheme cytochrome c family protein
VFFYLLHPKSRDAPTVTAPTTPEAIARGEYLAKHVAGCVVCHSPMDERVPGDHVEESKLFAGRVFPSDGSFPGKLVGPNITSAAVGKWTDGELLRAIREGVDRDGKTLFPMMPYGRFKQLTDDDALAIIAYLRSVPAQSAMVGRTEVKFPVSMFIRLAPKPLSGSPPAWPTDPLARGKILLEVMSCVDCHTPMDKGQLIESKLYAGGNKFSAPEIGTVYSSNITPDPATGIGAYSDDDLMRVFREGKGKDGRTLWVMPWRALQGAKDEDLRAVIAALRTLKPIVNANPAPKINIQPVEPPVNANATPTATGSAGGSDAAGSAAGSAGGSDAAGSAAGSAGGSDAAGSAAGSAATGSAATGSPAGSASAGK